MLKCGSTLTLSLLVQQHTSNTSDSCTASAARSQLMHIANHVTSAAWLLFSRKNIKKEGKKASPKWVALNQAIEDLLSLLPLGSGQNNSLTTGQAWRQQSSSRTLPQLPATAAWGFPEPKVLSLYLITLCGFFCQSNKTKWVRPKWKDNLKNSKAMWKK